MKAGQGIPADGKLFFILFGYTLHHPIKPLVLNTLPQQKGVGGCMPFFYFAYTRHVLTRFIIFC